VDLGRNAANGSHEAAVTAAQQRPLLDASRSSLRRDVFRHRLRA
jgi:hypothetical protein